MRVALNRQVKNLGSDVLRAERSEITGADNRGDAVLPTTTNEGAQGQWKLDIICCSKHRRTGRVDVGKCGMVQIQLHSYKLDCLTTINDGPILEWQENCRVGSHRGVIALTTSIVVEAENLKYAEVEPAVLEEPKPFLNHAFDGRTEVQLSPKSVKHNMELEGLQRESCLVYLEGAGALVDQHRGVGDGVQIHGRAPNRDWNQHLWGKGHAYDGLGGVHHRWKKESRQQLLEPQLMAEVLDV